MAATLVEALTHDGLHQQLLDTGITFRQGYQILAQVIADKAPRVSWAVIDQAWLLLRPTFVWYRTTQLGDKRTGSFDPLLATRIEAKTATYPLEPMRRYLDCLRTTNRSDDRWWTDRFAVPLADPTAEKLLMCTYGHVQSRRRARARRSTDEEFHCSICTGQRIIPGYNSLGDVMPHLALEWDQEANGDLTPYIIGPGYNGKVAWKDKLGHHYDAYVTNRTIQGTGCRFCASKAVLAGFNDLATTHPELAAMWDYPANGELTPRAVSAGNADTIIHLRCPNGHSFSRTPAKLVEAGGRCQTCHGKILIPGTNDLASARPDVAVWWHPTKNGPLTPDQVKPGSETKVWWMCPEGHSFDETPAYRCGQKKATCPVTTGRLLLPGVNDLATKEPDLVKDWDYEGNGFGPETVVPGTGRWTWTCKYGHSQDRSVVNRRRAGGCTKCPPEERVEAGERKNTRGRQGWDKRIRF
ncbi:zinc-ribbon domain-containing protein [Arthrobacter sp. AK04]|uniref:zinc-ribbon domain-containing protein n=1 Tax=Arthrobacter sp. AK04 TaxID=2900048 RepID=UPI001E4AA289|nr:zinc-ribbon domain-containing protein [Arthrobacter sp. AK04]MCD5341017.1 zinc-ribbon domain-containing protein [Arthrobacter sp. AK04]